MRSRLLRCSGDGGWVRKLAAGRALRGGSAIARGRECAHGLSPPAVGRWGAHPREQALYPYH
eukprot:5289594-Pleurochrysis_carterae.AAC.2